MIWTYLSGKVQLDAQLQRGALPAASAGGSLLRKHCWDFSFRSTVEVMSVTDILTFREEKRQKRQCNVSFSFCLRSPFWVWVGWCRCSTRVEAWESSANICPPLQRHSPANWAHLKTLSTISMAKKREISKKNSLKSSQMGAVQMGQRAIFEQYAGLGRIYGGVALQTLQ